MRLVRQTGTDLNECYILLPLPSAKSTTCINIVRAGRIARGTICRCQPDRRGCETVSAESVNGNEM